MVTGIVLSGGSSRRMGRDKAQMDLNGQPLISHVIQRLEEVCPRILVVSQPHHDLTLSHISDRLP